MRLHPVKLWPIPNLFVTYGVRDGHVFEQRRAILGYSIGGRKVRVENVSSVWAQGRIIGDVHFDEGSHTPVVWKRVFRPQLVRVNAEAAINREKHRSKTPDKTQIHSRAEQIVHSAETTGCIDFGHDELAECNQTLIENTDWVVNGNGTVSNKKFGTMWIQGLLGQTWNGKQFVDDPIELSWEVATRLFGLGVYFDNESSEIPSDDPIEWTDTSVRLGFQAGTCAVRFAGLSDWRLPTAEEACQLSLGNVGGVDSPGDSSILDRLFPATFHGFCCANGLETWFNPLRLRREACLCWKGRKGRGPNDENPTIPYPVLFCRSFVRENLG